MGLHIKACSLIPLLPPWECARAGWTENERHVGLRGSSLDDQGISQLTPRQAAEVCSSSAWISQTILPTSSWPKHMSHKPLLSHAPEVLWSLVTRHYFDNWGLIPSASSMQINKLISLSTTKLDTRISTNTERLGKLYKLTQDGCVRGFLTTEATLWITLAWNIVRKKKVHDPVLNSWDGACPHLVWAKCNSKMSQEALDNNQETIPRLIPLAWTLGTIQGHSLSWKVLEIKEPPIST